MRRTAPGDRRPAISIRTEDPITGDDLRASASSPRAARSRGLAAVAGIVAGGVGLATAAVAAMFTGAPSNPVAAVGALAIDLAPAGVKDAVIAAFGTGDKPFLIGLVLVIVAAIGAVAGILGLRRPGVGVGIVAVLGAIGVLAATTRADAGGLSAVPALLGMLLSAVVLAESLRRLRAWLASQAAVQSAVSRRAVRSGSALDRPVDRIDSATYDRRRFLGFTSIAGVAALAAGIGSRAVTAAAESARRIRSSVTLPTPASAAPAVPAGTDLKLADLTPWVTPNDDFYRIDTALQVPALDSATWSLKVGGMVENPIEISFAELLKKPLIERYVTLACVSNEVGGDLIGNALWLGYPIRDLLAEAGPKAGADMVLSRSSDGFTAGTPLSVLTETGRDALLAVGMNGAPLPLEHGFPARLVVPGLYGYVSATKWVTELTVTTFAADQGYWTPRGWTARGPIKTEARIDRPPRGSTVPASGYRIAGVAWDQHTGIDSVEVRVDDGQWQRATLAATVGSDTWRQWYLDWTGRAGDHTVTVRATNADGTTQTTTQAPPAPNGASGYPQSTFRAS